MYKHTSTPARGTNTPISRQLPLPAHATSSPQPANMMMDRVSLLSIPSRPPPSYPGSLPPGYCLPTFTTDGLTVFFHDAKQKDVLFKTNTNLFDGRRNLAVRIKQMIHRAHDFGEDYRILSREKHIYNFNKTPGSFKQIDPKSIDIHGTSTRNYSFVKLTMTQQDSRMNSWKVRRDKTTVLMCKPDQDRRFSGFKSSVQLHWMDHAGNLLAVETKAKMGKNGTVESRPLLEIKAEMDSKSVNLLVTAWLARNWWEIVMLKAPPRSMGDSKLRPTSERETHRDAGS